MTDENYFALVAKAKAGTLTDEDLEALDAEARSRFDPNYAQTPDPAP